MALRDIAAAAGRVKVLDPVADLLQRASAPLLRVRPIRDLLSGTWFGHALHPVLTDVPIGCFLGATVVDLTVGEAGAAAAQGLIVAGLVSAGPTALTGINDWSDTTGPDRRVGTLHSALNVAALGLYGGSLLARRAGGRGAGIGLALAGFGTLSASGYLGGHLVYARGVRVDATAREHGPARWTRVASTDEIPESTPVAVQAGEVRVLLYRRSGRVYAVSNTCSHMGGPLDEGQVDARTLEVSCPWHGSVFRLEDGSVVHGPASAPQPGYEARVTDGGIEVRQRPAGQR